MGTWDVGPYDNDDAMDFLGELEDLEPAQRADRVRTALLLEPGYLELPDANAAMAAAALVAGACGMDLGETPEAAALLRDGQIPAEDEDRDLAKAALVRLAGQDSEWRDEGAEAGTLDDMLAAAEDIRDYL